MKRPPMSFSHSSPARKRGAGASPTVFRHASPRDRESDSGASTIPLARPGPLYSSRAPAVASDAEPAKGGAMTRSRGRDRRGRDTARREVQIPEPSTDPDVPSHEAIRGVARALLVVA